MENTPNNAKLTDDEKFLRATIALLIPDELCVTKEQCKQAVDEVLSELSDINNNSHRASNDPLSDAMNIVINSRERQIFDAKRIG